jgi:hypothetical protein
LGELLREGHEAGNVCKERSGGKPLTVWGVWDGPLGREAAQKEGWNATGKGLDERGHGGLSQITPSTLAGSSSSAPEGFQQLGEGGFAHEEVLAQQLGKISPIRRPDRQR